MAARRKKLTVIVAVAAAVALTGAAMALWSATGQGDGRATALSAQDVTVTAVVGTADLYPGFTNGDVYFTLTNTNPYAITFTDMTVNSITSLDIGNCPSANVTVTGASGLALNVAANTTSGTLSVANVATMLITAPNGCQGVGFNVNLTLTGSQI